MLHPSRGMAPRLGGGHVRASGLCLQWLGITRASDLTSLFLYGLAGFVPCFCSGGVDPPWNGQLR